MLIKLLNVKNPSAYSVSNGCYYDKNGSLTDWTITLLGLYSKLDSQGRAVKYVRFYIKFKDDEAGEASFDCLLSSAINGKVQDVFEDNQVFAFGSKYRLSKLVSDIVKCTTGRNDFPVNYSIDQGYLKLPDGKMVFGFGDEIINAADDAPVISESSLTLKLSDDSHNFVPYLMRLMNNFPPAALIAILTSFVKPIFENELIQFGFTLYICGQSGKGKTELAKLLADFYEGHDNMVSLSSDKYALKKMGQLKDIPTVCEDLCLSASSRIKNAIEAKASDFIQMNQGGGNCCNKDIKLKFNNVSIITAEYVMKNNSTVNRCLLVGLEDDFNSDELSWLQRKHGRYIAFLKSFISWLCVNYDLLSEQSEYYLKKNQKSDAEYKDKYVGTKRIMRTYQILGVTRNIFLRYLKEVHSLSDEQHNEISAMCQNSIDKCIADTLGHCPSESTKIGKEFVDAICEELSYDEMVTSNLKEYRNELKRVKQTSCLPEKIFYFNGEYICVEPDLLIRWLKRQLGLETIPTKQKVSAQLKYYGLLKVVGGEYTSYISEDKKHKYYQLHLQRLREIEAEYMRRSHINDSCEADDVHFVWDYTATPEHYGSWNTEGGDDDELGYEECPRSPDLSEESQDNTSSLAATEYSDSSGKDASQDSDDETLYLYDESIDSPDYANSIDTSYESDTPKIPNWLKKRSKIR